MFRFTFKKQKQTKARKKYEEKHAGSMSKGLAIIFVVCFLIFAAVFSFYIYFIKTYFISDVYDISMQPTLNKNITSSSATQDFVYVNKKATPDYGDIVTIKYGSKNIIKRVIAKGGDKVSIIVAPDGVYHVSIIYDGTEEVVVLEEDYIKSYYDWRNCSDCGTPVIDGTYSYESVFYKTFIKNGNYYENVENIGEVYYSVVPEDSYFCLGDNRAKSKDSRAEGYYGKNSISGVAEIIVKDGNIDDGGWLLGKKLSAIFDFYWAKIAKSFAR